MPKQTSKTDEVKQEDATPSKPTSVLTVSQFAVLSENERNAFRDAGGTVTKDN